MLTTAGMSELDQTRFAREAMAMGQLSWHPNIVVVHDTGVTELGHPYITMEYLEGGSLGERLRRDGALPLSDAVDHTIRLSAAVHTAHDAGLLHRDVKPDNALLDAFGRVKLADFGIAAVTGSTLTASGLVTATVAHAAPEVLNGQRATPAADVYSLGSTLFELLAGTSAFARPTDESIVPLVLRATSDPVPDLRPHGVPDEVAQVVEWAMAKEPEGRPPNALELGRSLQGAQKVLGMPVTEMSVRGGVPPPSEPTISRPTPTPQPTPGPAVPMEVTSSGPMAGATSPVATGPPRATTPPPGQSRTGPGPGPQQKRRRKAPVVVLGLAAVALAAVLFMVMTGGGDDGGGGGGNGGGGGGDAEPEVTEVIPVGARPFRVAATDDAVWITDSDGASAERIDPATNQVVATVPLGGEPVGVAITDTAVWVAIYDTNVVLKIDPETNTVAQQIGVGQGPRNVAATTDDVWVANLNDNTVSRADPDTGLADITIPVDAGPRGIAVGDGAVWVTSYEAGMVDRIDPATNQVVDRIDVGGTPAGVAVTDGAVWVGESESDQVIWIDSDTNEIVDRIDVDEDPGSLAAAAGAVWVPSSAANTLSRIDPESGEVTATIDVGNAPSAVAGTDTDLWVTNTEDNTVSRIDPG